MKPASLSKIAKQARQLITTGQLEFEKGTTEVLQIDSMARRNYTAFKIQRLQNPNGQILLTATPKHPSIQSCCLHNLRSAERYALAVLLQQNHPILTDAQENYKW